MVIEYANVQDKWDQENVTSPKKFYEIHEIRYLNTDWQSELGAVLDILKQVHITVGASILYWKHIIVLKILLQLLKGDTYGWSWLSLRCSLQHESPVWPWLGCGEDNIRRPTGRTTEGLRWCDEFGEYCCFWRVRGIWEDNCIGVNRPAFGGTVPHFHQMSRGPAKSADVPHFSKMILLFFSLPIILHVCLATQHSDELRIKIGKDRFKIRTPTGHWL